MIYYFVIIFGLAVVFAFKNGILFALAFLGTAVLPAIAIPALRWSITKGDRAQKIGGPIFGLLLIGLAYWLSRGVSVEIFGLHLGGLALLAISIAVGFLLPLSLADSPAS